MFRTGVSDQIRFDFRQEATPRIRLCQKVLEGNKKLKGRNMREKGDRDKLDMSEDLFTEQNM